MPTSRNKPPPCAPPEVYVCPAPPPPGEMMRFGGGKPVRRIVTAGDHALFTASGTHRLVLGFIRDLNTAVYNRGNSSVGVGPGVGVVAELSQVLDKVREVADQFPPEDAGGSRFGNRSFRAFYDRVAHLAPAWGVAALRACPPSCLPKLDGDGDSDGNEQTLAATAAAEEIMGYLCEAWGNRTRIDYGSGHELNFVCWMYGTKFLFYSILHFPPPKKKPITIYSIYIPAS